MKQLMINKVGNRTAADASGGAQFANFHSFVTVKNFATALVELPTAADSAFDAI
jgi:hypothetical protein